MRRDIVEMSDSELWDRLGSELAEWAHSGVVAPVTVDHLFACLRDLDPRPTSERVEQGAARRALESSLDELYHVLISSDSITREVRQLRHSTRANLRLVEAWKARRRLKRAASGEEPEQTLTPSTEPISGLDATRVKELGQGADRT